MSKPIISVKGLSKRYKLGVFNAKTLREEAEAFLSRFSRKNAKLAGGSSQLAVPSTLDASLSTSPAPTDEFWALRDVSFDVQPGEVIGVIGRNGAGKSTLLKILSRITEPTSGEARIRGRVASLLEVGTGFHPELSGRENIFLNGAILGMTKQEIRNKFEEIVAFAEIDRFIDTPVKRYSSGMYVRLAFAVAAHLEPEILIVDEVLAVGDVNFQSKCLGKMRSVSAEDGRTVLFVSHNTSALRSLCSSGLLLGAGELAMRGNINEVVSAYEEQSVRAAPPNALLPRRVSPELEITECVFEPSPIASDQPARFRLTFMAYKSTRISELCLLIFSPSGVRVGVIDLRRSAGAYEISPNVLGLFTGDIARLNLVEGEYFVGLYLDTAAFKGDIMNLASIVVTPRTRASGVPPYPPAYRGYAELEYRFEFVAERG